MYRGGGGGRGACGCVQEMYRGVRVRVWNSPLGTFIGQNYIPLLASAHVQMTHFKAWLHFTDLLQYLAFYICFLVSKVSERRTLTKKMISDVILNFCWCHLKSDFWFVYYAPVTWSGQCHEQSSSFHEENLWYKFEIPGEWITLPLIRTILEKSVNGSSDTVLNLLHYDILLRISRIYPRFLLISRDDIAIIAYVAKESQL